MIAPGTLSNLLPIDLLHVNEQAKIVELQGDESQIHRLAEMGLRIGASIRMVRPGSPCLLAIDGKRLSIRLNGDVEVLVAASA